MKAERGKPGDVATERRCKGCAKCADLCGHEYDCFCDLNEPDGVVCDGSGVLPGGRR